MSRGLPPRSGAFGTTAIVGLIASAGFVLSRGNIAAGRWLAPWVGAGAIALLLVMAGLGAATASSSDLVGGSALTIEATNAKYSTKALTANACTVTIAFTNNDLFRHTFTISALGVDIQTPVKGSRRVSFNGTPGTYEFFCAVPGHEQIGMKGRLTIR
jgi:plastocyanin